MTDPRDDEASDPRDALDLYDGLEFDELLDENGKPVKFIDIDDVATPAS